MHHLADGLELRALPDGTGHGVFATTDLPAGTLLAVWGGRIVRTADLAALSAQERHYFVQVEDDLHLLTPASEVASADFINHSCDPNAGMAGPISLVALRDIAAGEEIRYDYAMSDSNPYFAFDCACAAACCRLRVQQDDWRREDLRARYNGWFSPYLQRRLRALGG